jgi:hypothetical protein
MCFFMKCLVILAKQAVSGGTNTMLHETVSLTLFMPVICTLILSLPVPASHPPSFWRRKQEIRVYSFGDLEFRSVCRCGWARPTHQNRFLFPSMPSHTLTTQVSVWRKVVLLHLAHIALLWQDDETWERKQRPAEPGHFHSLHKLHRGYISQNSEQYKTEILRLIHDHHHHHHRRHQDFMSLLRTYVPLFAHLSLFM